MLKINHLPPPPYAEKCNRIGAIALVCSAMLAACQKEETGTMTTINIMAEDFHGGDSKMGAYINASRVNFTWETGDEVRINDGVFAVTRSNANATISAPEGQPFTAPIRALSPASLYGGALTSDQVQVTLPDTYQWSTFTQRINGLNTQCQKLNAPMAFYGDANNLNYSNGQQRIVFKNLCGALAVKITNTTGLPLDMEEIQVSSNRYKLSGNLSINFTNLEGLQPVSSGLNSVTMRFDNEDLTLQANESKVVLIPVLPVGDNNRFKITVKYRNLQYASSPSIKHCFTYERTQPNSGNNALARSQFGYAPIDATRTTTTGSNANPKVSSSYFFRDTDGYNRIKDKYQLHFLSTLGDDELTINPSQAKIRIVRDIDMVGLTMKPLYGVTDVDGGGHTISNASFETNTSGRVGLLDNPTDASIKDLTLESPKISVSALSGTRFAGFLIAKAEGTTTITNCHVDNPNVYNAAVSGTYNNDLSIGGLIGCSNGSLNIASSTVIKLRFSQASSSSPNYLQVNCGGMVGYASLSSSENIQMGSNPHPYWNQVVIDHENTVPLVANLEVRFGGVIGVANGGSNWDVDVDVCVGLYRFNDRTPFVVKSMTSDVYAGHVLGRETNPPQINYGDLFARENTGSDNRYIHIYNDYTYSNSKSYLEVHKLTGKTAYTGRETAPSGTGTEYGHIVGNNNSYYNGDRYARELKVNVVNN